MITLDDIEAISPERVSAASLDAFRRFIKQLEAHKEVVEKEEADE